MESLIRETALDVAARRLGLDPIEIRRRNLVTLKDQPTTSCMGIPLEDITPAECLDKLLEKLLTSRPFAKNQKAARKKGRYLGLGIAAYIEPTGSAGSIVTMTGELAQGPHRADRQGHRDDEHAFAGPRHRNDHGADHRRPARRGLRGRNRFRG